MTPVKLFLAMPGYRGGCHNVDALLHGMVDSPHDLNFRYRTSSLLTQNFNALWAEALTLRLKGEVTHYLMIHTDVQPLVPDWVQKMLGMMEQVQADVLSVIIPIKDERGLTSTALESGKFWDPRRLTMREVLDRPLAWTDPGLLVNTGLMLVRFDGPWVESCCFTMGDKIERVGGEFVARCEPEDWNFSRQVRALGKVPWATRVVPVRHWGDTAYPNDRRWGTWTHDGGP